jgi:hypothetical protein
MFLLLVGAPLFAVDIVPSKQAKLILSILKHTKIGGRTLRILVARSDSSHSKNLIRHLRKTRVLRISDQNLTLEVLPLKGSDPSNGDVVILMEADQDVIPGVFCMAFEKLHVDKGATLGILTEKDRIVLYLNPESARKVGVKFQMGLVRLARLKGGQGL